MQTVLLTILVLGLLVFVHEFGHFITAKWAGILVPRFSIGLGPRLIGYQSGETDYCLSFGEGIQTTKGTRVAGVDSTALGEFPELGSLAEGGAEITTINGREVGNWYEIDRAVRDAKNGLVEIGLNGGDVLSVPVDSDERGALVMALYPLTEPLVVEVESGSPAARAGIQPGDRIVSIDGEEVTSFAEVVERIRDRPDQRISVEVERAGPERPQRLSLTVQTGSEQMPRASDGKFVATGWLGVTAETETVELGPIDALSSGTGMALQAGTLIIGGIYQLVTGEVSVRSLGGPVAIGQLTGRFARRGWQSLIGWIALFSINLAILNLLPIPVLDGGHILFLGIEALRGRPLSARQKIRLSQVGLAFLVLLMVLALTSDMLRLIGL
jgi:regulator of sigma E protease